MRKPDHFTTFRTITRKAREQQIAASTLPDTLDQIAEVVGERWMPGDREGDRHPVVGRVRGVVIAAREQAAQSKELLTVLGAAQGETVLERARALARFAEQASELVKRKPSDDLTLTVMELGDLVERAHGRESRAQVEPETFTVVVDFATGELAFKLA